MNVIDPPPSSTSLSVVDRHTKNISFHPLWLRWFINIVRILNNLQSKIIIPGIITLYQGGVPIGVAGGGSIASGGILTLTTGFATTYSNGIYIYFPAGAVEVGSVAGCYWTIMTSTTQGTIYRNIYVSGTPRAPLFIIPPYAGAMGAYTVAGFVDYPLLVLPIPAKILNLDNKIAFNYNVRRTATAGTTIRTVSYGGSVINVKSNAPGSFIGDMEEVYFGNRGRLDLQVSSGNRIQYNVALGQDWYTNIDSTAEQILTITENGPANLAYIIESFVVLVYPFS